MLSVILERLNVLQDAGRVPRPDKTVPDARMAFPVGVDDLVAHVIVACGFYLEAPVESLRGRYGAIPPQLAVGTIDAVGEVSASRPYPALAYLLPPSNRTGQKVDGRLRPASETGETGNKHGPEQ
jgi:hypothetical protein